MDGSPAPSEPISLDERDLSILEALQKNGQLTVADLSARVGLSPSACHRRVKALERAGIIDRYVAVLNPRAMGRKTFPVWLDVNLSSQNAKAQGEFEAAIEDVSEIRLCHFVGGTTDYLLKIEVEDSDAFDILHRKTLSVLPHVERIVSKVQIREVFSRPGVPLRDEA
ncbi:MULTISPECIES: Lrp/AsnC family transcriptional regulator [Hyphobacterium]|uniref:Lrp/AsnC family transcriptional regulator n=1 Tax=Hyphobacterium vulgare TaxID=1736751 RepID=A0ABV7A056_9PROT